MSHRRRMRSKSLRTTQAHRKLDHLKPIQDGKGFGLTPPHFEAESGAWTLALALEDRTGWRMRFKSATGRCSLPARTSQRRTVASRGRARLAQRRPSSRRGNLRRIAGPRRRGPMPHLHHDCGVSRAPRRHTGARPGMAGIDGADLPVSQNSVAPRSGGCVGASVTEPGPAGDRQAVIGHLPLAHGVEKPVMRR
jgi:hypothetical protein